MFLDFNDRIIIDRDRKVGRPASGTGRLACIGWTALETALRCFSDVPARAAVAQGREPVFSRVVATRSYHPVFRGAVFIGRDIADRDVEQPLPGFFGRPGDVGGDNTVRRRK